MSRKTMQYIKEKYIPKLRPLAFSAPHYDRHPQ